MSGLFAGLREILEENQTSSGDVDFSEEDNHELEYQADEDYNPYENTLKLQRIPNSFNKLTTISEFWYSYKDFYLKEGQFDDILFINLTNLHVDDVSHRYPTIIAPHLHYLTISTESTVGNVNQLFYQYQELYSLEFNIWEALCGITPAPLGAERGPWSEMDSFCIDSLVTMKIPKHCLKSLHSSHNFPRLHSLEIMGVNLHGRDNDQSINITAPKLQQMSIGVSGSPSNWEIVGFPQLETFSGSQFITLKFIDCRELVILSVGVSMRVESNAKFTKLKYFQYSSQISDLPHNSYRKLGTGPDCHIVNCKEMLRLSELDENAIEDMATDVKFIGSPFYKKYYRYIVEGTFEFQ